MAGITPRRVYERAVAASRTLESFRRLSESKAFNLRPTDRTANPLTANPRRYWSHADEDGILEDILRRIGSLSDGVFLEYGVGDGTVCNTVVLLAWGWRGAWISNEDLAFDPKPGGKLVYEQSWITRGSILQTTESALKRLGRSKPLEFADVTAVSLDLDGNDYHLTELLLNAGIKPNVWIAEYNPKFPVGVEWVMDYDDSHTWQLDDYYGASLSAFARLFENHGYFPVACSAQGANVFFVKNEHRHHFDDVPKNLADLYQPLLYGHPASGKTIRSMT